MSTEKENKSVGLSKSDYEVFLNKLAVADAKRDTVVHGWIAKSGRANEPRKTQAELEAEDAALFRPQPPRLGLGCPIPPQFLKSDAESSTKDLRAKFFPSKTLKASKARDAEEKAASAKRGLNDQSSDEEGGRSSLGRAKKLKTKPHQEAVKNEIEDVKHEPGTRKPGTNGNPPEPATEELNTTISTGNSKVESPVLDELVVHGASGEVNGSGDVKSHENRKKKPEIPKTEHPTAMEVEQDDSDDTTLVDRSKDLKLLERADMDRTSTKLDRVEVGEDVADEAESLRRKEAKRREKRAKKKERKEKRRSERAAGIIS
jgi:hypothetical protein